MEIDFKKLFKNKYFLIGLALAVAACLCVALAEYGLVFYILACFFAAAFCGLVCVYFFMKAREVKHDNKLDLVPLSHEDRERLNRQKKFGNMSNILRLIFFAGAAIGFIIYGFKLIW